MRHALDDLGWAQGRLLVGLDYDGTLAPIVTDPQDAAMSEATRAAVAAVAARLPTVVISGRSGADLAARLGGLPVERVGNHGAELAPPDPADLARVAAWAERLRAKLPAGVLVEDKGLSVSVHARGPGAGRVFEQARALAPDARAVPGKDVVNLVLAHRPHKGHAVLAALERHGCARAVYVGDDWTDEDVFALGDPRVVGIRVGADARSAARLFVTNRDEVDRLLEQLARGG